MGWLAAQGAIMAIGVFVKRNFLGAGKSYMIKGKQAEKKAENAPCGRLKCVLVAGNINPCPPRKRGCGKGKHSIFTRFPAL